MMTSTQIRQSFLDFFKSKQHTIVPSSSLMPDSPNLLFTNAGMNQFVPIFLGQVKCPYSPGRAADTQKCIRAGGKHNDLDDVGLDTYHHTFFEMLGNWSFGDYFKKEAIDWAWELVVGLWKFPPQRLYATVYHPDKSQNDPSEFDREAWNFWAEKFRSVGLDPAVHIVNGNKKDNFWMMGDTGPCGPCSELHVDLTPLGDTKGSLVNKGDARCIEIWNLVFIQFNAQPATGSARVSRADSGVPPESSSSAPSRAGVVGGTPTTAPGTGALPIEFVALAQQHVDTGMGFERVTSIIQGTKGFTDFQNAKISNYETDIFRPIFDALEKMSGKRYASTLPGSSTTGDSSANPLSPDAPLKTVAEAPGGIIETSVSPCATAVSGSATPASQAATAVSAAATPGSGPATAFFPDASAFSASERPFSGAVVDAQAEKGVSSPQKGEGGGQKATGTEQEAIDIAFRVIADHIRTLSFAIADGIQPGNTDRNYVLRRILRRAVRYGRTLGFHEPFFYKLVDVLAQTMGDVFPEIRTRKAQVQETIRIEEEAFNRTLDRGIELFNEEVGRITGHVDSTDAKGSARVSRAVSGVPPGTSAGAKYSKRRLPHFERPWAKYMVTFSTVGRAPLSAKARDIVLQSLVFMHEQRRLELFAACVLPDHVHFLFEPQIKEQDQEGKPVFWSLTELLHSIKSFTAHEINKVEGTKGNPVWEKESFDRMMRGDADLEEKFHYICRNPWEAGVAKVEENYPWIWTPQAPRRDAEEGTRDACAPPPPAPRLPANAGAEYISGNFAFKLYDTYGFPLDLTELMARERGLSVDTAGFEKLMDEQRARARAAQKKEVISLSQIETTTPTHFLGYDHNHTGADVQEVVALKDKTAVVLNNSVCYAEMGGQVGDTGELTGSGQLWRVTNTQKSGNTWLHFIEGGDAPAPGQHVTLQYDAARRNAIQRHHTVTHLLHWALHEVASKEASQKGSFVGPDKLTFDFNSAPLTPAQVADIEKLVNERILENAPVSWTEVPHAEVKHRKDVMQFFGDKYGDMVRVVQVGGDARALNGYSMELCGGTHTRATGEIGLFRIVGENAIAAGVRRIEAVAGLTAYDLAQEQLRLLRSVAGKINSPMHELEKKIEALLAHQKELEKSLRTANQKEATGTAKDLIARAKTINGTPALIANLGTADGDTVQSVVDAVKSQFKGVIVLGAANNGAVTLIAAVTPEFTAKVQAGKIIQTIAPIVGGKGGGKPDNARGGGKDASKLDEALAKAAVLIQ